MNDHPWPQEGRSHCPRPRLVSLPTKRPSFRCRLPVRLICSVFVGLLTLVPSVLADEETPPDIWHRDTLTGDWGGLRKELADQGVVFTMTYTGEVWGNVKGGIKQGATYDGQLLPQVDVDLDKLMGWKGASFRASMLQGHGPALSVGWVGNLLGASSIVAVPPATRLYNLWLQQNLFDDLLSVRVGVMNIDAEFFTSVTASLLMNTTFGWPGWLGVDLPGGGPAYPLSDPGVRIRLNPGPAGVYAQAAVFSGDPTGHGGENTGLGLPVGTTLAITGGALIIAEAGYAINQDKGAEGLPLAYKLGGWYHTGTRFQDQQFASNGVSLASPQSNGMPLNHTGDWGVYAIADGVLYRVKDGISIAGFLRVGAGTPNERNLVSFYSDAGLTFQGLIPGRDNDIAGLGVGFARIGNNARGLDQDTRFFSGDPSFPIRSQEVVMELTYQAQVTPWLSVQPDVQYIFNPSGGVLNPNGATRRDALVLGLRSALSF